MGIGEQKALGVENHTTALAPLHPLLRRTPSWHLKEATEQGIHQQSLRHAREGRPFDRACCFERDHRRATASDGISDKRLTRQMRRHGLDRI